MNTTPLSPKTADIELEGGVTLTIQYDRRAECRMGTLKRPMPVSALNDSERGFSALCSWLWACLSDKDDRKYPSPEAISLVMTDVLIAPNFAAFYSTWKAVQPPEDKKDPLTNGSKNGPSPASSSN